MAKTMRSSAQRAKVSPISQFSPTTWRHIKNFTPYVTFGASLATSFISPIVGATLGAFGTGFYFYAKEQVPKPVFDRNPEEPCINFGTDEFGLPLMIPVRTFVRHSLLVGTTGSGKTTTIRSIAESFMKLGGGFCFIDGKADVTDTYKILYEIVKNADREEDLLVLNFLNPNQSHTFNFLLDGEPDFLAEIMAGLCQDAQGDQAYWQGKAKMLMKTILAQLIFMRDHPKDFPEFRINVTAIKKYLILNNLKELYQDGRLPQYWGCHECPRKITQGDDESKCVRQGSCGDQGIPVKARLHNYLAELGVDMSSRAGQKSQAAAEAERQHGFYVQQWGEPLDLLFGAFGKIFNAEYPDIDIKDVVVNSRILVVLLPSLSFSPSTLRGLGRVVMNTFKIALTTGLGKEVEGNVKELEIQVKRNRPSVPFMLIADEYGSYAVEGVDTMLAQARSLGMGIMISVQELASLMKASEIDAKRIMANTNLKFFMKIEDTDTAEYVAKRVGEEMYLMPSSASVKGEFLSSVSNEGNYQYQKQQRLEPRDLTSLEVGEGFVIFQDEVRKYKTRYIPEKFTIKEMRLMKYVHETLDYFDKKKAELLEKAQNKMDKIMTGALTLMSRYAIGVKEDRLYKQYIDANTEYIEENMVVPHIDYENEAAIHSHIHNLQEQGFLKIIPNDLGLMKEVIPKRAKYQTFKDRLYSEAMQNTDFLNTVLKPSDDANKFVAMAIDSLNNSNKQVAERD